MSNRIVLKANKQSDDRGLVECYSKEKFWLEFACGLLMFRMTWRVDVKKFLRILALDMP